MRDWRLEIERLGVLALVGLRLKKGGGG